MYMYINDVVVKYTYRADPVRHQLVLNKGESDGVFVGQPLIDAAGLMGQIVEVQQQIQKHADDNVRYVLSLLDSSVSLCMYRS